MRSLTYALTAASLVASATLFAACGGAGTAPPPTPTDAGPAPVGDAAQDVATQPIVDAAPEAAAPADAGVPADAAVDAAPPAPLFDFDAGVGMQVFAGQPGAAGFIDGVGGAARLSEASFATDGTTIFTSNLGRIRKVDSLGEVTTLSPIGASSPTHFAMVHAAGKIFAASEIISEVNPTTGQLTRLAGGGIGAQDGVGAAARFGTVQRLAWDGGAYIYSADLSNAAIRRVTIATGEVVTIAGALGVKGSVDGPLASARFNEPRHIAYFDGALYVRDTNIFHKLRKIDLTLGTVSTLSIAPTNLDLNALASDGTALYGAYGWVVYRLLPGPPTAITSTARGFADGTATGRFWKLQDLQFEGPGSILALDAGATMRRLDVATGNISTIAGALPTHPDGIDGTGSAAAMRDVRAATTDGKGTVYFTDSGAVRSLNLTTREVRTIAGKFAFGSGPDGVGAAVTFGWLGGIAWSPGGLYVTDGPLIRHIDPTTALVTTLPNPAGLSLSSVGYHDLVYAQNRLYVRDASSTEIRSIDLVAKTSTVVPTDFLVARQMAYADGSLVILADRCVLARISLSTGAVTKLIERCDAKDGAFAVSGIGTFPRALCANGGDRLYNVEGGGFPYYGATIRSFDLSTSVATNLAGTHAPFSKGLRVGDAVTARFNNPTACIGIGASKLLAFDEGAVTLWQ